MLYEKAIFMPYYKTTFLQSFRGFMRQGVIRICYKSSHFNKLLFYWL